MSLMLVLLFAAYLLGSIPFGLVLTKLAGLGDIRAIGSGNIGATNVLRTGNKKLALATLLLDGSKGALAVWLGLQWATHPMVPLYMGVAAVLGHVFPVWLRFKGGKGVATMLGFFLAASWPVGLSLLGIWLGMAALFRYSSLAAITAAIAAPPLAGWITPPLFLPALLLAMVVVYKHQANLKRLLRHQEPKIGKQARVKEG